MIHRLVIFKTTGERTAHCLLPATADLHLSGELGAQLCSCASLHRVRQP